MCGLDEAGRGALAGPIVVAAVVLAEGFAFERIAPGAVVRDSKLLSQRQRLRLLELIEAHCVAIEVTAIGVGEIDTLGIDWANTEGFRRLIRRVSADAYVVDGRWRLDGLGERADRVQCLVRADETVPATLAAGVVAKVRRDEIMRRLDVLEPGYGWSANTGHGTAAHIDAVRRLGPTAHHRRQFVATALAGRRRARRRPSPTSPTARFRNVYLYITEACQLRCGHCYMGQRLERALKMPYDEICRTLTTWRKMGGRKLTILGGEPTMHRRFVDTIRFANEVGYEHVITTTNGLRPAARKILSMSPEEFAYVQVSLDGGSAATHDQVRGPGMFAIACETITQLAERGFDTRIICTVNRANRDDAFALLDFADEVGASLVKYHVFSVIGRGHGNEAWAMEPPEWVDFYEELEVRSQAYRTRVWYQPTYARRERVEEYAKDGYRGCIGRTLDRISIFPDGRCYVCSYLFDTNLHFATQDGGDIVLNRGPNEFELFATAMVKPACGSCKVSGSCMGGCPAEEVVMGQSSCAAYTDIVPVCRLWKADVKRETVT